MAGLLMMACCACDKYLDIPPPDTQLPAEKVFSSETLANKARAGMYADIMAGAGILNGMTTKYLALFGGELNKSNIPGDSAFILHTLTADNKTVEAVWISGYKSIAEANAIIAGLAASMTIPEQTRARLSGDARFIRALIYFYMVNLFGDTPLVLGTDVEKTAVQPRAPISDVYDQIIADLLEAQAVLPAFYGSSDFIPDNRVWASSRAATALLARVYLYLGRWADAAQQASQLIEGPPFSLTAGISQVFLAGSNETIFQLSPIDGSAYNTQDGAYLLPPTGALPPPCMLSDSLLNAFEPGDARKVAWVKRTFVNGLPLYSPYKYKIYSSAPSYTEYNIVFRLAEQCLIRAEARAQLGNFAGALQDLNIVRSRAGLPALPASTTQSQLLQSVIQERRVELFVEWGHRWLDLKRTGYPLPAPRLWPIPAAQLLLNTRLTQNPGY